MSSESFRKAECPSCAGRLEYPVSAAGMTIACPHCRESVRLPAKPARGQRRLVLGLSVLLGLVLCGGGVWVALSDKLAGSRDARASIIPKPAPADLQRVNRLAFWDFAIERKEGSSIIHAVARVLNESDSTRYAIEVRLELMDAMGRPIGTARDFIDRLESNQAAHIRALVIKRDVASVRVVEVTEQ